MCNIPCGLCGEFDKCKMFYVNSRCRTCIHDKEDFLKSPCFSCIGSGKGINEKDFYSKSPYSTCIPKKSVLLVVK